MKLIRCNNGHFYDEEKYATCPHCGVNTPDEGITVAFAEDVSTVNTIGETASDVTMKKPDPATEVKKDLGEVLKQIKSMPVEANYADGDVTVALGAAGKAAEKTGTQPVVGWLVCLNGKHMGQDYRIQTGKNFIGRDKSMDIALTEESAVSRQKHAVVLYEPKMHMYMIQSGDSKELTYVNDKVVLESVALNPYDTILVGEVQLLFIPLCSGSFNWAGVLKED